MKGGYEPEKLLYLVHGRVKASREDIKEALTGYVTEHHRFMLRTIQNNISRIEETIAEIDVQITEMNPQTYCFLGRHVPR
jgi:transposase